MLGFSGLVLRVAPFAERPCGAGPFVSPLRRGGSVMRGWLVMGREILGGAHTLCSAGSLCGARSLCRAGSSPPALRKTANLLPVVWKRKAHVLRARRVQTACGCVWAPRGLQQACAGPTRKPERWDAGLLLGFPNDEGRSLWTGIGLERFATCLRRYAWA